MGRLINFDGFVQEKLNAIVLSKTSSSGIIIGQSTDQKDIAIHLCPTPKKDELAPEQETESDRSPKNKNKVDLIELDEKWICFHAKQLLRALPGGLDVLGLYIVAPTDYNTKQQAYLRQILFAVFKTLGKSRKLNVNFKERILLGICPVTSKIVCRTYDVTDFKSSANPAEWKLLSGNIRWQRVRCQVAVDIKFPIKSKDGSLSFLKQVENGLTFYFHGIEGALALINGVQRDSSDLLDLSGDSKRTKKKQSNDKGDSCQSPQWHDVELFIPLDNEISNPKVFDGVGMMIFKGVVQCQAYVHQKATVGEAVNALKEDILRSIRARIEIHSEDLLLIEEEQKDPIVVHELPRRVFAPLPQGDIYVCDYQFHNDTASDSLDAFKELLNLSLDEEDIDTSCEKSPTTSTLILPEVMDDRLSEFGDAAAHSSLNFYIPVAGFVVTIAAGLASLYMRAQGN